ncbi:MAG: hypothetical protein MJ221_04370 [Bacilli bacterium]|nr:hypothetical protein [Bacilli bacterium]
MDEKIKLFIRFLKQYDLYTPSILKRNFKGFEFADFHNYWMRYSIRVDDNREPFFYMIHDLLWIRYILKHKPQLNRIDIKQCLENYFEEYKSQDFPIKSIEMLMKLETRDDVEKLLRR